MMRSVKRSRVSWHAGSEEAEEMMWPKSEVPVRAAKPDFLFRISSAYGWVRRSVC